MPDAKSTNTTNAPSEQAGAACPPEAAGPARDPPAPGSARPTPVWNNLITMVGFFLMLVGLLGLLTFALFSVVARETNPYVDIVGYLVLPGIMVVGMLIVPVGILIKSWRLHRRNPAEHLAILPHIDLNDPAQRRAAKWVVGGTFILLPVVGVSSYHGFHYTDSANFCAKACHEVMEPQATTYEHSAHARVACAECHIGAGAGWFVKSKLSGTRQVLAVWQNSFSRPIPPAITELRPARETCEECHWPKKFFGAQLREIVRFAADERNTRRDLDMLLLTGGGDEATGRADGIHKHMALAGQIRYVATDDKLQNIPWVEFVKDDGQRLVYRSDGQPSSDPKPTGQERMLDCMDCHNRPAHEFQSPQEAVDLSLDIGRINTALPFIKREATQVLAQPYPDVDTARLQIGLTLTEFYRANYPEIWSAEKDTLNRAIQEIRRIYAHNSFPDMHVDWQTYPDNIGHLISPGCFRCHDGSHVNQYGERISHDCSICHTFLQRVEREGQGSLVREGRFIHSYELTGPHARLRCDACHTGGPSPVPDGACCHTEQAAFRAGTTPALAAFDIPADVMADSVDCEGCHDLSEPISVDAINAMCLECHDDEKERFEGMLAAWQQEVEELLTDAEGRLDPEGKRVFTALRSAGPLHNMEAARKIMQALATGTRPAAQP